MVRRQPFTRRIVHELRKVLVVLEDKRADGVVVHHRSRLAMEHVGYDCTVAFEAVCLNDSEIKVLVDVVLKVSFAQAWQMQLYCTAGDFSTRITRAEKVIEDFE